MSQQILLLKKGDLKTGFLSKKTAGEFHFYEDKIVFTPIGLSRLFNSAPIIIEASSMIRYSLGFIVIGYSIKLETRTNNFNLNFLGDKIEVLNMMNLYINN